MKGQYRKPKLKVFKAESEADVEEKVNSFLAQQEVSKLVNLKVQGVPRNTGSIIYFAYILFLPHE